MEAAMPLKFEPGRWYDGTLHITPDPAYPGFQQWVHLTRLSVRIGNETAFFYAGQSENPDGWPADLMALFRALFPTQVEQAEQAGVFGDLWDDIDKLPVSVQFSREDYGHGQRIEEVRPRSLPDQEGTQPANS